MKERRKRVAVFWPVGAWLLFGGVSAFFVWFGLENPLHVTHGRWNWTVVVAVGGSWMAWSPVVVAGRESLWLVRLFGLYWKRVRGRNLLPVEMWSHSLVLKDNDGWIDLVESFSRHRNRRIAETLHGRLGVEIKPSDP